MRAVLKRCVNHMARCGTKRRSERATRAAGLGDTEELPNTLGSDEKWPVNHSAVAGAVCRLQPIGQDLAIPLEDRDGRHSTSVTTKKFVQAQNSVYLVVRPLPSAECPSPLCSPVLCATSAPGSARTTSPHVPPLSKTRMETVLHVAPAA